MTNASVLGPPSAAGRALTFRASVTGVLLVAWPLLARPAAGAEPQAPTWHLSDRPEVQIGEMSGEEAYLFQSIVSVRYLPDGAIVVADGGFLDIRVFESTGSLRARMGGRGRGPGEFRDINSMWLTSAGAIAAWDPVNRRITTFTPDGTRLSADRVEAGGAGNLEVFFGSFANDDVALASLNLGPRRPGEIVPDVWIVQRYGLGGGYRAHLGQLRGMRRFDRNPVPFTPVPFAIVRRDSLFVSDGYEAGVTVWDASGAKARTLEPPFPPSPSAGRVWSSLEAALRGRIADADANPLAPLHLDLLLNERVPRDDRFPHVAGLLLDSEGHVWVKVYDPLVDSIWLKRAPHAGALAPGGVWQVLKPPGGTDRRKRGDPRQPSSDGSQGTSPARSGDGRVGESSGRSCTPFGGSGLFGARRLDLPSLSYRSPSSGTPSQARNVSRVGCPVSEKASRVAIGLSTPRGPTAAESPLRHIN